MDGESPMNRQEMLQRLADGESPLEVSIQKWQDIVDGIGKDDSSNNCALCNSQDDGCKPCVIFRAVGYGCSQTPYGRYTEDKTKENAQAELDFLKSLREEKQ